MHPDKPESVYQTKLECGAIQYKPIIHVPGAASQLHNSTGLFTQSSFIPHNAFGKKLIVDRLSTFYPITVTA